MSAHVRLFFEQWELFREPVLAAMLAGGTLGVVGVWLVLRRMVFLSAALSQVAGLGVALAVLAGQIAGQEAGSPGLGAVVATVVAALALSRPGPWADVTLGIALLTASAATLAVGTRVTAELHEIEALLFGSAVAVLPEQLYWLGGACGVLLVLHVWLWRGFAAVTLDRDDALVRGLPVAGLEIVLIVSAAVAVAVTTWVLGALPAFGFSVLPAVAALRVGRSLPQTLALACVCGVLGGGGGYLCAFLFDLPVGASQTLAGAAIALVFTGAGRVLR